MFIDLHTHILPGLDDGAQTIKDSLDMLEVARQDGILTVVATPHVIRGVFDNSKQNILNAVSKLNKTLVNKGIEMTVLPGAEYSLEPDLAQRLVSGDLLTINNNGKYIMIELPSLIVSETVARILYEIQLQGVTPIIAHPERNYTFSKDPNLLKTFVDRGILAQVTSNSIMGIYGKKVRRTAFKLIQIGAIQIMASDGHNIVERPPILSEAYKILKSKWGSEFAKNLVVDIPRLIIECQTIERNPVPNKQNIWSRFQFSNVK